MDQVDNFKPYHISLYLALFRRWNYERFKNPISISRDDMMRLSKIGSPKTYLKALKDLQRHGFVRYDPSHDPNIGSLINLFTYEQVTCSLVGSKMPPFINNTNSKQTNTLYKEENNSSSNSKNENMKSQSQKTSSIQNHKSTIAHPPFQHIQIYFQEKGHHQSEAERFFNYYESNGWLIGGKIPMKDWKAAARNWMLNIKKFEKKANDTRKKQFEVSANERSHAEKPNKQLANHGRSTKLRPTSQQPSSSNYDEPL
ncbi:transcriptional regulator [Carboxylicivirga sp. M1479]|uniref:transcriptional regulator n=1 Tax=Carboxylicivirga sp. M1479 TaxID=2594476 RepID=UPI001178C41B|nr:transcriptional regulator [Carboxylicivirga sp. M1479]TRX72556.1 transcriptional regulator [Carboxylicivirga sp. M1479]